MTGARPHISCFIVATLAAAGVLAWAAAPALAAVGETWTLPIHHRDGGGWVEYPGAGYDGTSAWEGSGWDGVRRVWWELSGTGSLGNEPSEEVQLYTIEIYAPTAGGTQWQPIESAIHGIVTEGYPYEDDIPWVGAFGTNHEYIGSDGANDGAWHSTGPGPHTPESADYNAGPNGIYMWLMKGSWLYAKWDFGWSITRSWSAIRLTQITPWGACCLRDGSCVQTSGEAECLAEDGGRYHGDGTNCGDVICCPLPFADADTDGDVDQDDFALLQVCITGTGGSVPAGCECWDRDEINGIDEDDVTAFEACASGPGIEALDSCELPAPPSP